MSKYTESLAITEVLYQYYTINNIDICSDIVSLIGWYRSYLNSRILIGNQDPFQGDFGFTKKIEPT